MIVKAKKSHLLCLTLAHTDTNIYIHEVPMQYMTVNWVNLEICTIIHSINLNLSIQWNIAVNSKGNQPWIFIARTDVEAETPIFWPPEVKNQLFGKDPDAGKDWKQEEKGTTEDEMVGWHHRHDGHELE